MLSRREFLKLGASVGAGVMLPFGMAERVFGFTLNGVTQALPLNPLLLTKFKDRLPIMGIMPSTSANYYEIGAYPIKEVPHSDFPVLLGAGYAGTDFWGYRPRTESGPGDVSGFAGTRTYLAPTIVAPKTKPATALEVKWFNELRRADGTPLPHPLPVDPSLHWADPLSEHHAGPYPVDPVTGVSTFDYTLASVPLVTHVHGGEQAPQADGGPDSWYTPDGINGPGYSTYNPEEGSWSEVPGMNMSGGNSWARLKYDNDQPAATIWYHDHALGMTRLNVYMGLAGAYVLYDKPFEDGLIAAGVPSVFAANPDDSPKLDAFGQPYDVPLVIQDRMFDAVSGQLYFPAVSLNPTVNPFWVPEFFGDTILVNGRAWPYMNVEPKPYRFRLLNGSNARVYVLAMQNKTGTGKPTFQQIATDGGYLGRPAPQSQIVIAPGEREEVVLDFSAYPVGTRFWLTNAGTIPYPVGANPDPRTTGQIMEFRVSAGTPQTVTLPAVINPALATYPSITDAPLQVRSMTLNEWMGPGQPYMATLNNTKWPHQHGGMVMAPTTELPAEGTTEVWEIVNTTGDAHPIHLHLVQFQVISRHKYSPKYLSKAYIPAFAGMDPVMMEPMGPPFSYAPSGGTFAQNPAYAGMGAVAPLPAYQRKLQLRAGGPVLTLPVVGGNPDVAPYLTSTVAWTPASERGWKDTAVAMPGEVMRILVRFAPIEDQTAVTDYPFDAKAEPGYVWHCHIIDHEDNEMMRPYKLM